MREPKPHVVSFLASLLLIAGLATVVDRPDRTENVAITVDSVGTTTPDDGTSTPNEPATPGDTTAEPGDAATDDAVDTGTTSTPGPSGPSSGPSTPSRPGSTGSPTTPGTSAPPSQAPSPNQPQQPTYPEAALYDDAGKVRGFGPDEIVMCGHAALALGAAFDTSREDLNVYWDMVNESGGIHGRTVTMTWEDDAYLSDQAVRAATACADKDPFMILGGIGFDQIPGVRNWAEANNELYLHHIAVAPEQTYNYSYSLSPTVQLIGDEAGKYLVRAHRDRKIGVMYRATPNWQPGSDAALAVMEGAGVDVTGYPVFQNQGTYANELNQMRIGETEVVFLWENALAAANIINQASDQGYYPTWVVFPFQQTIDLLREPGAHTLEGIASWNAYAPGGYGGAHSEFGVDAEIARFEAAYDEYRPGTTPNDILWQVWVGNKIFHRMLLDCGADCNRNRFAGMMLSGYQAQELPGCKINFADPRSFGGHHGGFAFFTQKTFDSNSGRRFETTEYCLPTLG